MAKMVESTTEENKMSTEKIINVPLKEKVRQGLDAIAQKNGRASSREAASIIERAVNRSGVVSKED